MFEHFVLLGSIFAAGLLTAFWLRRSQQRARLEGSVIAATSQLDALPAAIWHTDAAGQCTYANQIWRALTGGDGDNWSGLDWIRAFDTAAADAIREEWIGAISREDMFEADWPIKQDGAPPKWLNTRAAPQFSGDGTLLGYRCVSIDVTRTKQREDELVEIARKGALVASEQMAMAASTSADARHALTGIAAFAELLQNEEQDAKRRSDLCVIADAGRMIVDLIDDGLSASQAVSGSGYIPPEPAEIEAILRHCTQRLDPMARAKGIKLGLWIDDAVPTLAQLDIVGVRKVISSLLSNAIKFTENGGVDVEARVESTSDGQHLLLSIIDSGIGIAPDRLRTILQTGDNPDAVSEFPARESQPSLQAINRLTQKMGGTVVANSKQNVGSNFTLRLPLGDCTLDTGEDMAIYCSANTAPQLLKGARVLLVEDDELSRHLVLALLAKLGLRVATVENGEGALTAIYTAKKKGAAFDAVLMDINLPDIDGFETVRRLRARGTLARELPVIALTAKTSPDDIAECAKAGMQAHIAKPFTSVALARELARCLIAGRADAMEAIDPEIRTPRSSRSGLLKRYCDRKGAVMNSLRTSLDRDPARTDWPALASELHRLAGAALQFGEPALGEASRRLEARLNMTSEPRKCHEHLRRAWLDLERGA